MQAAQRTYLQFVVYPDLINWSTRYLIGKSSDYNKSYSLTPLSNFLTRSKDVVTIDDNVEYRRVTVRIKGGGVLLRDREFGKNIGTKRQFLAKGSQFIISKIDARNGALGIVPIELNGAIVTNDFPLFDINTTIINPDYLRLITTTDYIIKIAHSSSSGTTNRQRVDIDDLLKHKIPLPTLAEQEKLVAAYNEKIQQAERLAVQGSDLEGEIEKYFLEQIGLAPFAIKEKSFGLFTINYTELERWDFFSGDARVNSLLNKSKYPIVTLGKAFEIAKRTWNKKIEKKERFNYIEIGAIDPIDGILEAKEVLTSKAPSRATQTVKTGDLIIGTTRPYLKKFAIVDKQYDGDVCSSGFTVIAANKEYHLPYLLQFLRCTYGVEQLKNKMTGGLYPAITESELKEIRLPFPDVNTQEKIMRLIKEKETEIINSRVAIENLKYQAQQEFEQAIFSQK